MCVFYLYLYWYYKPFFKAFFPSTFGATFHVLFIHSFLQIFSVEDLDSENTSAVTYRTFTATNHMLLLVTEDTFPLLHQTIR